MIVGFQEILSWFGSNSIEIAGTIAGIAGVWLTTKQIIWCWPVNLINVCSYIYVFFINQNFAYFGLQIFYLIFTIYGWYNWRYGGEGKGELKVSRMSLKMFAISFLILAAGGLLLGIILKQFTTDRLPFLDSFMSIGGVICTYLSARKLVENWLIWVVIDMISVGMFFYQSLYPTVVLYIFYSAIALYGYFQWRKDYFKTKQAQPSGSQ